MKTKFCKTCNVEFSEFNFKKYCSRICYEQRKDGYLLGGSFIVNCCYCNKEILKFRSEVKRTKAYYCNNKCSSIHIWSNKEKIDSRIPVNCTNCDIEFLRFPWMLSDHMFCGLRCSGLYSSQFTKRRDQSKMEIFISQQIRESFSSLQLIENDRSLCKGLELDLFLPELNLAIEINGPVHYDPIYGEKYLESIQERDFRKNNICQTQNIEILTIKNYGKFLIENGNRIWFEQIKPVIESKLPFPTQKSTINQALHTNTFKEHLTLKA